MHVHAFSPLEVWHGATTLYGDAGAERHDTAHAAKALAPIKLEVAERWTGPMLESDKRRVLPKPRTPASVR